MKASSLALLVLASCFVGASVRAQEEAAPEAEEEEEAPLTEEIDETRLDVERLPPEAIRVTRELYAHGFFVEAMLGVRGFINGAGDYSNPGPWASIGVGYEITDWLHAIVSSEGSFHQTNAPSPPPATVFEVLGGTLSVRIQGNISELFALWVSAQLAVLVATTNILDIYGVPNASDAFIAYGGEVGGDFHFRARHHSMGFFAGLRHYPSLEGQTSPTLGIHGGLYLRYVF